MLARIAHAHSHFCFSARPKNSVSQPGEKLVTSRSLVQGLGTATGLPRNCYITVLLQKRFFRYLFKSMQFLLADGELVFLVFSFCIWTLSTAFLLRCTANKSVPSTGKRHQRMNSDTESPLKVFWNTREKFWQVNGFQGSSFFTNPANG